MLLTLMVKGGEEILILFKFEVLKEIDESSSKKVQEN